jgi:hypothetical protein
MRSRALTAFAACAVVVAIVASAAAPTRAIANSSGGATALASGCKVTATSLVGLARGEAMSLNFTNVGREVLVAALLFLDRDGHPVKASRARVGPGESLSLGLSYGEVADPAGIRPQTRVVVIAQPPDPEADRPSELGVASLEVFDEGTGKSAYGLLLPAIRPSATGGGDVGVAECDEYIKK